MASACGISQLQAGSRLLPKLFWWLKWKSLLAAASQPLKNPPLCSLWHFSQWLLHRWGASDGPGDHNTNMCLSAAGLRLLSYCRSQMTFLIESESNCGDSCHYRDHDANMCLSAVWPWAEYAWKSCYACSWFSTKTFAQNFILWKQTLQIRTYYSEIIDNCNEVDLQDCSTVDWVGCTCWFNHTMSMFGHVYAGCLLLATYNSLACISRPAAGLWLLSYHTSQVSSLYSKFNYGVYTCISQDREKMNSNQTQLRHAPTTH